MNMYKIYKDKLNEQQKLYYAQNKEKHKARVKAYYEKNKKKISEKNKAKTAEKKRKLKQYIEKNKTQYDIMELLGISMSCFIKKNKK